VNNAFAKAIRSACPLIPAIPVKKVKLPTVDFTIGLGFSFIDFSLATIANQ
jgi:hypothetical protein